MNPTRPGRPGRLDVALWESERHSAALADALQQWSAMPAVPSLQDIEFDPAVRQPTDQILFRFIKLQDALGERLVPGTLDAQAESFEAWPMRDRFDRREKLGYLDVAAGLRN